MKKIGIILALFLSFSANAQSDTVRVLPKNAIYFELAGNGGLYSINYERMFWQKNTWRMAGRIGLEVMPVFDQLSLWNTGIPIELVFLRGKRNHFLEMGVGLTSGLGWYSKDINDRSYQSRFFALPMLRLGYRYQADKGFIFRAGLLGFPNLPIREGRTPILPWLGFSFGKSF